MAKEWHEPIKTRTSFTSFVKAVATARSVASPCMKPGVYPSTSSASQPHSALHAGLTYCYNDKEEMAMLIKKTTRTTVHKGKRTSMKYGSWQEERNTRSCRRNTSSIAMAGRFTRLVK